jgi:hypothetical protein
MAKNWGRTPIANADKRHATQISYMAGEGEDAEERIDRRPMGKVERFVCPQGGVMSLVMFSEGDPKRAETEQRNRAAYHRKGFVEHAKCPIRTGTRHSSDKTARDFAKMPASLAGECKHEIRTMKKIDGVLHIDKGCPHIEWLITYRQQKDAKDYEKRNAQLVAAEKRRATNDKLAEAQATALVELMAERKAAAPSAPRKAKDVE